MKNKKQKLVLASTMIMSLAIFSVALAENGTDSTTNSNVTTNTTVNLQGDGGTNNTNSATGLNSTSTTSIKLNSENNSEGGKVGSSSSTTTDIKAGEGESKPNESEKQNNATNASDNAQGVQNQNTENTNTSENNNEDLTPESHGAVVSNFVHELLNVADKKTNANTTVGAEVKAIATNQSEIDQNVPEAITNIENRSKIKTFLIGSDYKNLGVLKSNMEKTNNQIDQLKAIADKTTNVTDKATLNTQIDALQKEQVKINAFIQAKSDTFSLFGWLFKLFN